MHFFNITAIPFHPRRWPSNLEETLLVCVYMEHRGRTVLAIQSWPFRCWWPGASYIRDRPPPLNLHHLFAPNEPPLFPCYQLRFILPSFPSIRISSLNLSPSFLHSRELFIITAQLGRFFTFLLFSSTSKKALEAQEDARKTISH